MKKSLPDFWCFNRPKHSTLIRKENIEWEGPFAWPGFETKSGLKTVPHGAGVYLFTYNYNNGFIMRSVGVTNSFRRRISQHTREYRKGNYTVLDVNYAQQGERKELWHGWGYAKQHREEFFKHKELIMQYVDQELAEFRLFITFEKELRKRERIEFAIMHHIYGSKEFWSNLVDGGMTLRGRFNSEIPVMVKSVSKKRILGLPDEMEI